MNIVFLYSGMADASVMIVAKRIRGSIVVTRRITGVASAAEAVRWLPEVPGMMFLPGFATLKTFSGPSLFEQIQALCPQWEVKLAPSATIEAIALWAPSATEPVEQSP